MRNNHQQGFTLIELIVVIAILGILAAVALPRFMSATKDAHQSAFTGTAGGLASAAALVRSQFELNKAGGTNGCLANNCQIDVQGFGDGTVDVNSLGWPIGTARAGTPGANIGMSAGTCTQVFNSILAESAPSIGGATADYTATAAGNTCTFTYNKDGGDDTITYNNTTGAVDFNFI